MLIENQTTAFGYFDRRDEVVCTSANEAVYRFASVLFLFFFSSFVKRFFELTRKLNIPVF